MLALPYYHAHTCPARSAPEHGLRCRFGMSALVASLLPQVEEGRRFIPFPPQYPAIKHQNCCYMAFFQASFAGSPRYAGLQWPAHLLPELTCPSQASPPAACDSSRIMPPSAARRFIGSGGIFLFNAPARRAAWIAAQLKPFTRRSRPTVGYRVGPHHRASCRS